MLDWNLLVNTIIMFLVKTRTEEEAWSFFLSFCYLLLCYGVVAHIETPRPGRKFSQSRPTSRDFITPNCHNRVNILLGVLALSQLQLLFFFHTIVVKTLILSCGFEVFFAYNNWEAKSLTFEKALQCWFWFSKGKSGHKII